MGTENCTSMLLYFNLAPSNLKLYYETNMDYRDVKAWGSWQQRSDPLMVYNISYVKSLNNLLNTLAEAERGPIFFER
jgi:hypothetical protein